MDVYRVKPTGEWDGGNMIIAANSLKQVYKLLFDYEGWTKELNTYRFDKLYNLEYNGKEPTIITDDTMSI